MSHFLPHTLAVATQAWGRLAALARLPKTAASTVLTALTLTLAALGGCGGGVEGQGTGSFSYVQGAISGYGSIIVNGVEFFDDSATVADEDGNSLSSADLKLGMTVSVQGGPINTSADGSTASATASAVTVSSALFGPVSARNASAGTLVVLGQTVRVGSATVFDESLVSGLASVAVGDVLKVHAYFDEAENLFVARRITPAAGATLYSVSGPVSALDSTSRTFRIGLVTYVDKVGGLLASLVDGQQARVKVQPSPDSLGRWIVGAAAAAPRRAPDGAGAEVEGLIGPDISANRFVLDGVSVDASSATVQPVGMRLAAGLRVEVQGTISGNTLVASKVEVKVRDDKGEDDDGISTSFELKGLVESVDAAQFTLRVRGMAIRWTGSTQFSNGTAADLRKGLKVEVKGLLGAAGTVVLAKEVKVGN